MTKDYKARLSITEFPKTKREREKMCKWLEKVTAQIYISDSKDYAKNVRFTMMK